MLHRHAFTGRFARAAMALVAATLVALAVGCGDELDPTEPEGAYYIFRNALLKGDAETVWKRTDDTTKAYFQQRYEQLEEMDETIERYLPQTDHKIARKQSGTILLDEVDGGKGLFMKVFQPKNLPDEQAIKVGSDIDELKVAEDDSAAKVVTRAGQEYVLKADKTTEEWHVMLVRSSDKVDGAFGWLEANESALQQTVEDLIAEEREKREAIIAELMNKEE
jgi:lipopolysaccharide export LptBFGC system permease protein LptF